MKKSSQISISVATAIMAAAMIVAVVLLFDQMEWYVKTIAYVAVGVCTFCTYLFLILKKFSLFKTCFILNITIFIVVAIFSILNLCGIFSTLSDAQNIKNLITSSGGWGVVVCFLMVVLQVVVLPITGLVFYVAITAVYGPGIAFAICYLATIVGSLIAFWIGRKFGQKAVAWCAGEETTKKYATILGEKGKVPFVIMQLLPFFPDDVLCMIAGLSSMSFKFFLISIILVKPIYIAFACFLGTGNIIPFSGWGIWVWIAIAVVCVAVCVLYVIYQKRIENWLKSKSKQKDNKKENN